MIFTHLGEALNQRLQGTQPLKKQIESSLIVTYAETVLQEILGSASGNCRALYLKNRTLTIACDSSAVAQEVRLHQTEIVEKINQKLGKKEVDSIRYLV